jgi:hypothetical protein
VKRGVKHLLRGGATTAFGGTVGAIVCWIVGELGLTILGDAIAITMGMFAALFGSVAGLFYFFYWWGTRNRSY